MNERQAFIIEDLDDYHLIIKADEEYRVRSELDTEVRIGVSLSLGKELTFCTVGEEHV